MATRERPGDQGADDARRLANTLGTEIRRTRRSAGVSIRAAARRSGVSASQLGRIERGILAQPTVEQLCRAARGIGLEPSFRLFPSGTPVHDAAQLKLLARFEALLGPPLRLRREVPLPIAGDLRAWDGRIHDGSAAASIEAETRLDNAQAVARRIELKLRDDPGAGAVILLVNRTAHNRRVIDELREALRLQFPLDGAAIARDLRRGRVPSVGGILML